MSWRDGGKTDCVEALFGILSVGAEILRARLSGQNLRGKIRRFGDFGILSACFNFWVHF